jgi:hypothetical protein
MAVLLCSDGVRMRNLLGRLNARSADDLSQIADSWQTPLAGRDRLAQVSQLYRTMTKLPMVRVQWDGLTPDQRDVIRALIDAGEAGRTIEQLRADLNATTDAIRSICVDLYAQGLIAYEGTSSTLPVGETPRLFVPLELANTIRKAQRELQEGDVSDHPLAELIQSRDERDLFDAAGYWGVEVITGVTTRNELIAALTTAAARGLSRHAQVETLGHEVRSMWEKLRAVPHGTPIPVDQLVGDGNERTLYGRRNAINELEDRLLVWPTVLEGGVRALFVPAEIASAAVSGELDVSRPKPVSVIGSEAPYRPPAPLAWDLMVVLQRMFGPLAPPQLDPLVVPRAFAAELNRMLWNRGADRPPTSYLETLIEFAVNLGLIREPDDGSTQFERTAAVREWRLKSWPEQTARIRSVWMSSSFWAEGQGRQDVEPWNVDWRGFRIKLLSHLSTLESGKWYRLNDVARWISEYDLGIIGPDATVALSHTAPETGRSSHHQGVAYLIATVVRSILVWLGLVRLHEPGNDEQVILVTDELRRVTRAEVADPLTDQLDPSIVVADDLSIHLTNPEPLHVWSVMAFADPLSLGQESVFAITAGSIRNAQAAGFQPAHISQFFERQKGVRLPADFADRLRLLGEQADGFELSTALVIDAATADRAQAARVLLENEGYVVGQMGNRLFVSVGTQRSVAVDVERIHSRLVATGLGPVTNRTRT